FAGGMGGATLNAPVAAVVPVPDRGGERTGTRSEANAHPQPGYWLVGADGGVFSFGDARFVGSLAGVALNAPVVSAAATPDGHGPFAASVAGKRLNAPIAALAANPNGRGYWLVGGDGGVFSLGQAGFMGSGLETG